MPSGLTAHPVSAISPITGAARRDVAYTRPHPGIERPAYTPPEERPPYEEPAHYYGEQLPWPEGAIPGATETYEPTPEHDYPMVGEHPVAPPPEAEPRRKPEGATSVFLHQVIPPDDEKIGGLPLPGVVILRPETLQLQQQPPAEAVKKCGCGDFFVSGKKGEKPSPLLQNATAILRIKSLAQAEADDPLLFGVLKTVGTTPNTAVTLGAVRNLEFHSASKVVQISSTQLKDSPYGDFPADKWWLTGEVKCGTAVDFEVRPRRYTRDEAAVENERLGKAVRDGMRKHIHLVKSGDVKLGASSIQSEVGSEFCGKIVVRVALDCDCDEHQKEILDPVLEELLKCDDFKLLKKTVEDNLGRSITVKCVADDQLPGIGAFKMGGDVLVRCGTERDLVYGAIIFEFLNAARVKEFTTLNARCVDGHLSRDQYMRETEQLEYNNLRLHSTLAKSCKVPGVSDFYTANLAADWRTFDAYYKAQQANGHAELYGQAWDRDCKTAYEKRQR